MRARLSTTFRSLTVRNYRLFAGGQLIKLIGVWMMYVAQDWLVLELSNDSPTALGLVTALQFVPVMLLTLYAGTLADRFDKRTLLMVSNGVWAVLAIMQAVLIATGVIELWHIMIFAGLLVLGLVLVTFTSTMPSTLPALFPTIIRYGALAIAFNVSVSLFGGTTPLATEALVVWAEGRGFGWAHDIPAFYLMAAAVIGLVLGYAQVALLALGLLAVLAIVLIAIVSQH